MSALASTFINLGYDIKDKKLNKDNSIWFDRKKLLLKIFTWVHVFTVSRHAVKQGWQEPENWAELIN